VEQLGPISEITSWLGSTAAVGALILLVCLVWITWSTRSGYSFRKLVWRIVHGKSEITDTKVRDFTARQDSLMHFKHHTGIQARTLAQVHRIEQWMDENDEGPSTLRKLGNAFDREEVKLRENQGKGMLHCILLFSILAVAVTPVFTAMGEYFRGDGAVITIATTKNAYFVEKDFSKPRAFQWFRDDQKSVELKAEACDKTPLQNVASGLTLPLPDVEVLCVLMTTPQGAAHIRKAVKGQIVIIGFLGALLIIFLLVDLRVMIQLNEYKEVRKRQAARQEKKELERESSKDPQD
jgi:hypothetical protein